VRTGFRPDKGFGAKLPETRLESTEYLPDISYTKGCLQYIEEMGNNLTRKCFRVW
jgi:hypothetical protein